jgi:hypothetical protein
MRGSKAKKLRRLIFGEGFHWPTVKKNAGLRRQYRKAKKARGMNIGAALHKASLGRRAAVNATKAKANA